MMSGRGRDQSSHPPLTGRVSDNRWRYNTGLTATSSSWANKPAPGESRQRKMWYDKIRETLLDSTTGKLKLPRRHRPDYLMFVLTVALALFGLIIIFSIAPAIYNGDTDKINREMLKRAAFLLLGIIAFFITSRISLDKWKKWGPYIFLFGLTICLALPLLGMLHVPIATCALGACRWYDFKIVSFQPAELLKLGTVLFMAGYLSTRVASGQIESKRTLIEIMGVMGVTLAIIVGLQKDMGTGIALTAIFLIEIFMSGLSQRRLIAIVGIMLLMGVLFIAIAPHRIERVLTFTKSGNSDTDYHINQALIALGSGGLTGRGLGQSVQAFGWLPEAVNDSIFAVIGETLGYVGTMTLIVVFAILIMKMFSKLNYLPNLYLRLIVAGIVGWFASHVLLNIGAMTHLIPLTGITLPLVSSGGTSLVLVMGSLGIVFEISRYTTHRRISETDLEERKGDEDESSLRWGRQRRSHNTHSSYNRPAEG